MDWLTLEWLMTNLEWAVGLLVVGCVILFFFPVLLGWQLKKDAEKDVNARHEAQSRAAKKAYTLREEEEEAARALETAQAAADEYEGQGGEWEKRTQKTLKEREAEHKRVSAAAATQRSSSADSAPRTESTVAVLPTHERTAVR